MPGTGLQRNAPTAFRLIANHVLPQAIPLLRGNMSPNVNTAKESGDALARLVTDPELAGTTGRYFEAFRQIRSSDESYDDDRAEELLNASPALTRP
jgi:hypothetical protein